MVGWVLGSGLASHMAHLTVVCYEYHITHCLRINIYIYIYIYICKTSFYLLSCALGRRVFFIFLLVYANLYWRYSDLSAMTNTIKYFLLFIICFCEVRCMCLSRHIVVVIVVIFVVAVAVVVVIVVAVVVVVVAVAIGVVVVVVVCDGTSNGLC